MALSIRGYIWSDETFPFTLTCYDLITSKKLLKSKTDPFRETAKYTIAKSNSPVCAVTALRDYLLQTSINPAVQPLFQFSDGRLQAMLVICGFDSTQYASHGFRIGAATTAGAVSLLDWLIKVLGRWKSSAYQTYIRTPKDTILGIPRNLASQVFWVTIFLHQWPLRTLRCLLIFQTP